MKMGILPIRLEGETHTWHVFSFHDEEEKPHYVVVGPGTNYYPKSGFNTLAKIHHQKRECSDTSTHINKVSLHLFGER